jgi:hypothetical protein
MRLADPSTLAAAPRDRLATWHAPAWLALAAVASTVAHLVVRGFAFGVLNNVYHVPFVLRLYDTPAFANDAFYQSLRGYVSMVWPILRLAATERNVEALFLAGHVLALLLAFGALGLALAALRVPARTAALLVVTLAGLAPLASVITPLGRELLLGGYFTHTELVHGLALLMLAAIAAGRVRATFVLAGLAIDVNVFAGSWLMFVATVVALGDPRAAGGGEPWRERLRRLAPQLALGLLVAAPAIAWTAVTVLRTGAPGVPADYRAYLWEFFPYHFLIAATPRVALVGYAAQLIAALAALRVLAQPEGVESARLRRMRLALGAGVALVAGGAALPFLTDARLLLNLHLLRAAALTWWIALLLAMAAIAALAGPRGETRALRVLAVAAALALVGVDWSLAALALSLAAWQRAPAASRERRAGLVLAGLAALLVAVDVAVAPLALENVPEIAGAGLAIVAALGTVTSGRRRVLLVVAGLVGVAAYVALVDRSDATLRTVTIAAAITALTLALVLGVARATAAQRSLAFAALLVTVCALDATRAWSWRTHRDALERLDRQDLALLAAWAARELPAGTVLTPPALDPDFQWQARHPAWVTWRSGAAVMWSPAFYPQWSTRMREVSALRTPAARASYACTQGIAYVLEAGEPSAGVDVLRREGRYALLAPRCTGR